ncbi:hypothetical protein O1L44_01170 [Streptomyces noursei]|nr:hypothetical protein [Streptomyces noursei]
MIVLLDDCDPLLDACAALVRRLLRTEPALLIMATARRPLGLPGERTVALAPLPVSLGEGIAGPAVELLAARTGPAAPELLVAVCRALEGCPLAIELAARQLGRMTLVQLAARLDTEGPLHFSGPSPPPATPRCTPRTPPATPSAPSRPPGLGPPLGSPRRLRPLARAVRLCQQ